MDNDLCLSCTPREAFLLFTRAVAKKNDIFTKIKVKNKVQCRKACQFVDAENNATKIVAVTDPSWRDDPGKFEITVQSTGTVF